MSHKHFCDVTGHEWECAGTALRLLAGDAEPSICMCIRHRVPMEFGDHSDCSIELLACPEHREDQQRRMEEASKAGTNIPDGWDELFRPMTDDERLQFEAKHKFMDTVVFAGLKNLNTGFDAPGIHHFSPADFGEVIGRCKPLHVTPIGIEIFTTDGGFIDCEIRAENISTEEAYSWAQRLVQTYEGTPDITMSATFDVPDALLTSKGPSANEIVDPSSDGSERSNVIEPTGDDRERTSCEEEK